MRATKWIVAFTVLAAWATSGIVAADDGRAGARTDQEPGQQQPNPLLPAPPAGQSRATIREGATATGHVQASMEQYRSSKIVGIMVRNSRNEELGTITDIVLSPEGCVRYVALSSGGFLGIGNKLIAVPWTVLTVEHAETEAGGMAVVLDLGKDKLANAPTFTEDQWPDFNDSEWVANLESFYGVQHTALRTGEMRGEFQRDTQAPAAREGASPRQPPSPAEEPRLPRTGAARQPQPDRPLPTPSAPEQSPGPGREPRLPQPDASDLPPGAPQPSDIQPGPSRPERPAPPSQNESSNPPEPAPVDRPTRR